MEEGQQPGSQEAVMSLYLKKAINIITLPVLAHAPNTMSAALKGALTRFLQTASESRNATAVFSLDLLHDLPVIRLLDIPRIRRWKPPRECLDLIRWKVDRGL